MTQYIKLSKGLNISLKGKAASTVKEVALGEDIAIVPAAFEGVTPKVLVKQGDKVLAGDALFQAKSSEAVKVVAPVSGTVTEVVRGERRKLMLVKIQADKEQKQKDFGKKDVAKMSGNEIVSLLSESGMLAFVNQLPYDCVVADPTVAPKAIFVSAFRDMPLEAEAAVEFAGEDANFKAGIAALAKIAKTYVGVNADQDGQAFTQGLDAEVAVFKGKCPAGNVSVQVNHLDPVNKGEVVWTVDPMAVVFIGRLVNTGKVDFSRVIAVAGSEMNEPCYVKTVVGQNLKAILAGQLNSTENVRIINGNPLTGALSNIDDYLWATSSCVTAIPENSCPDELFGWIMPRFNQFSTSRTYFSWLQGKKEYALDARMKGEARHMIMSGEYDKVFPMDIYPEYLVKAIIAQDIDKMEQLGIYEVSPKDFALAEFVCSSKQPLQAIVREGLNMLKKENS
ncbi:MAG: Na(+)-translocating NADH-quinone reductase subunit A [Bacteroidaceae bacterium]|nr:Na(+)-translocating NADH-quinone reductase subunit A [Bacteroidaceae bacterium]